MEKGAKQLFWATDKKHDLVLRCRGPLNQLDLKPAPEQFLNGVLHKVGEFHITALVALGELTGCSRKL